MNERIGDVNIEEIAFYMDRCTRRISNFSYATRMLFFIGGVDSLALRDAIPESIDLDAIQLNCSISSLQTTDSGMFRYYFGQQPDLRIMF